MTTFDLILVALTVVMYIAFVVGAGFLVKKGMKPLDAVMEVCAVLTFTSGGMNKNTLYYNILVFVSMAAFAWLFTVPGYMTLFFTSYIVAWVVQSVLHFAAKAEYKNHLTFGYKVGQLFF